MMTTPHHRVSNASKPWWKRTWLRVSATVTAVGLIVGLVMDVGGIWSWLRSKDSPTLGLATYQIVHGHPVLTNGAIMVDVEPQDIFRDRLRLSVPIAVTNLEHGDLDVVGVEMRYPRGLNVRAAGRAKIDPTRRTIVYDHRIGTLRAAGDFTPLAPLDKIVIPFNFTVMPTVALSSEGVPFYSVVVVGSGKYQFKAKIITLSATLYFAHRASVTAELHWAVEPGIDIVSQGSDTPHSRPITKKDRAAFRVPHDKALHQWTQRIGNLASVVQYRKFRAREGEIQAITVNHILRRVIIDADADGYVDRDLIDLSGDGAPDVAETYPDGRLFVDWWDANKG